MSTLNEDANQCSEALGLRLVELSEDEERRGAYAVISPSGVRLFKVRFDKGQCVSITMPRMDDVFGKRLRIKFTDENLTKIALGKKTMTRRIAGQAGTDSGAQKVFVGETMIVCNVEGVDTGVRCRCVAVKRECLQDISEQDAVAEGCKGIDDFKRVWGTIYKEDSERGWGRNPQVFAYEFEPIKTVTFGELAVGDMFNVAIGRFVKVNEGAAISVMRSAARIGAECMFHAGDSVIPLYAAGER